MHPILCPLLWSPGEQLSGPQSHQLEEMTPCLTWSPALFTGSPQCLPRVWPYIPTPPTPSLPSPTGPTWHPYLAGTGAGDNPGDPQAGPQVPGRGPHPERGAASPCRQCGGPG